MCAIAGIISAQADLDFSKGQVASMLRRMRHRGPDGSGLVVRPRCVMGSNRLAQIDAAGGGQPMCSPDGRWILVFNGEIYNHRELRQALLGLWQFTSCSDTEVLLAALIIWGEAALPRLNGMFAFFLWDSRNHCGFAARDRLGVKPLVWTRSAGGMAFASEAKALLEVMPGRPTANVGAVLEYFVAPAFSGVETPLFANMHHLAPGSVLTISDEGIKTRIWWSYDLRQAVDLREDWLAGELHDAIPFAVTRSLDTDQPAAVFLSGGLDSTLVAACAVPKGVTCAYTIGFEGQSQFDYARSIMVKSDDQPFAVEAAGALGLEHRIVTVSRSSLADDLRVLAVQNDAIPAWEQELAQHYLARAAAKDYRAVLVGDAADETHYGYNFTLNSACGGQVTDFLTQLGRAPLARQMEVEALRLTARYEALVAEAGLAGGSPVDRQRGIAHLLVQRWLPRLLHNGDIHTMAHSVEARVPFADTALLDLAVKVHPDLATREGTGKSLLRRAARGLMPETARLRRKSSLPKDDACAQIYQREAGKALHASEGLLGTWLNTSSLRSICAPAHVLTESERALLFRVICFHHWAEVYQVQTP